METKLELEEQIDNTQGDLHDLELELEDMKNDGITDGDEFNELANLIYYLNEFITMCEDQLEELEDDG